MTVCKNIKKLIFKINKAKTNRNSIGFIPTMGALHKGHLSLIQKARKENDVVVVSIFVNPKQFNNPEDLKRYPRTIERDVDLIRDIADIIFIPDTEEIYPKGFGANIHISPLADIGEGKYRPGHFDGMATVVLKLFHITQPTRAYFGKKDYQQYLIVKQMVRDLHLPIKIVGGETIREESGLAMSSRNVRLSHSDKEKAPIIYQALQQGKEMIQQGEQNAQNVIKKMTDITEREEGITIEYIEIRNMSDFLETDEITEDVVILIAAQIGEVRLIDNIEVHLS